MLKTGYKCIAVLIVIRFCMIFRLSLILSMMKHGKNWRDPIKPTALIQQPSLDPIEVLTVVTIVVTYS